MQPALFTTKKRRLAIAACPGIEDAPSFGDLAVLYPPDTQGCHVYAVAGGRYAHKLALVCSRAVQRVITFSPEESSSSRLTCRSGNMSTMRFLPSAPRAPPGKSGSWRVKSEAKSSSTTSSLHCS